MLLVRFRVLTLLILTTIVSGFLAWWVQPKIVTAQATFMVLDSGYIPAFPGRMEYEPTEREIKAYRQMTQRLITENSVLAAALDDPMLQRVDLLRSAGDPIEWLENHLETEYEGESELLTLKLRGPEYASSDLVAIVDAVCEACTDELVSRNRLQRANTRDQMVARHEKLEEHLRQKVVELVELKRDGGDDMDTAVDIRLRESEFDASADTLNELTREIEWMDIEFWGTPRVSLVERAHITSE